jgi:hypothetical protein
MHKSFTSLLLITSVILAMGALAAWAQPPDTLWTQTVGGSNFDNGTSGQETSDGGFIAVGQMGLAQPTGAEVCLIRLDANGDTTWTRTYGGDGTQAGQYVRQTADGGYIIAGYTDAAGNNDAYLIKTNANGDTTWTKVFSTATGDERFFCVQELAIGGYIAVGHTTTDTTSYDVWLYRIGPTGSAIWVRRIGGTNWDIGRYVMQTSDAGFLVLGFTLSAGAGGMDMYLIKTDPTGQQPDIHTYGGTDWDHGYSMAPTDDGGYILAGDTKSFGAGAGSSFDGWLVKIDSNYDTLWTSAFGTRNGDEIAYSVSTHPDGGYVLTGEAMTTANGKDVWVVKTDANGDSLWQGFWGGTNNDQGNGIFVTGDQGYFIVGQTQSFGAGSHDFYMVRLEGPPLPQIVVDPLVLNYDTVMVGNSEDAQIYITNVGQVDLVLSSLTATDPVYTTDYDPADSVLAPGDTLWVTVTFTPTDTLIYEDTLIIANNDEDVMVNLNGEGYVIDAVGDVNVGTLPTSYALHSAVPNPFNPTTSIQYDLPKPGQVRLEVFDSSGRKAATLVDGWKSAGVHGATFDGTNLASGVYVCRLTAGNFEAAAKMVLMK